MGLHQLLDWVRTEGEVGATNRLHVQVLPVLISEGILMVNVSATTECSLPTLDLVRRRAEAIVGKAIPDSLLPAA